MKKKIMPILLSAILILQCVLYNMILPISDRLQEKADSLESISTELSELFIKDTIRAEQREVLNAIRQAWVQYVTINKDIELLLKEDGKYVYINERNERILFDPETMKIHKNDQSFYCIYDKQTNKLLIDYARPQWNKEVVQEVLSVVANPARMFDTSSELIAFDIYTGDIFLNTGSYIDESIIKLLMQKNDTQRNTGLISLHYEKGDMTLEHANDFSTYKLGKYDRLFIEKVVLPYESVGVEGLDMQIGISIAVRESELMKPYQSTLSDYNDLIKSLSTMAMSLKIVPKLIVIGSIVIIFMSLIIARKKEITMIKKKRE